MRRLNAHRGRPLPPCVALLPISGGQSLARVAHMPGAYWGFCLMCLHLGLHWGMVQSMVRRLLGAPSKVQRRCLRDAALAAVLYGFFAFFKRRIHDYLFVHSHFVFFDFNEPRILFFLDYLATMVAFTWLGHYLLRRAPPA